MFSENEQFQVHPPLRLPDRKNSIETEINSVHNESFSDENVSCGPNHSLFPSKRQSETLINGFNNPYYQSFGSYMTSEFTQSNTDRFIPCRKLLQGTAFKEEQKQVDFAPEMKAAEQTQSVSQLYRKILLTTNSQQQAKIKTFKNKNKLQFKSEGDKFCDSDYIQNTSTLGFTQGVSHLVQPKRKVNKVPFKILDAPTLQDDYYLNLIDWSSKNVLSVGLSSCVYLWNSQTSRVTKLCEQDPSEAITSVAWSLDGSLLAVGATNGIVQVWDPVKVLKVRSFAGHHARVGSVAWNGNIFTTGSRDKSILNRDLRMPNDFFSKWISHKQEVCGLKWSFDGQQLCSGGNDNRLLIWNLNSLNPVCKYEDHRAAVKAMAWSPHHHGLLVSGGGTADRTIRFRDTLTGSTIKTVEVGSQVCNLMFSKSMNELVSTHGYSHNQINIWKCPKMEKVTTLTGHTMRVLYLSMSPDGSTIVTGAGDETLRFWTVFPGANEKRPQFNSNIQSGTISLR